MGIMVYISCYGVMQDFYHQPYEYLGWGLRAKRARGRQVP